MDIGVTVKQYAKEINLTPYLILREFTIYTENPKP